MLGVVFLVSILSAVILYLYHTWKQISNKLDLEIMGLDRKILDKHQLSEYYA